MKKRISTVKKLPPFLLASLLCLLLFAPAPLRAHPPSNMVLNYSGEEGVLEVTITHGVGNPSSHYVESVVVERNGEIVLEEEYEEQKGNTEFTYEYRLSAENGDTFEVNASCNRFGDVTSSITVESVPSEEPVLLRANLTPEAGQLAVEGATPPSARGIAVAVLDGSENTLEFGLAFKGLSGPATGLELLRAEDLTLLKDFGEDSEDLSGSDSGLLVGRWNETNEVLLSDEQVEAVMNGEIYVNVTTELNPEGELRGRLREIE